MAVNDPPNVERTTCPFLIPTRQLGRGETAIGIYCRFPDGHVRVPDYNEIRTYCLGRAWDRCPSYRRHAFAATPPIAAR
jgi:hypothetical protein